MDSLLPALSSLSNKINEGHQESKISVFFNKEELKTSGSFYSALLMGDSKSGFIKLLFGNYIIIYISFLVLLNITESLLGNTFNSLKQVSAYPPPAQK